MFQNVEERAIRQQLQEATQHGHKLDLQTGIQSFNQLGMEDKGDLTAGKEELEVVDHTER